MRIEANSLKKHGEDCRAEGKAEGRTERNSKIAKKILAMAVDIELIAAATDLTKDEILKLK